MNVTEIMQPKPMSFRPTVEQVNFFIENFERTGLNNNFDSVRDLFFKLFNVAINSGVNVESNIAKNDMLASENVSLKCEIDDLNRKIEMLQDECERLKSEHVNFIKTTESVFLDDFEKEKNKGVFIPLNSVEKQLIDDTCENESLRMGRSISGAMLLKEMFMTYTFKGTHDHYPRIFSTDYLREKYNALVKLNAERN